MKTYFNEATVLVCCLVCLQTVNGWDLPDFCHGYVCPEFVTLHENENYEERFYNSSLWLTTESQSTDFKTLKAARDKLKAYINGAYEKDKVFPETNPTTVTVITSADQKETYNVSFYVPPDTMPLPKPTDPSISWYIMPAGTVFVRVFGGMPSVQTSRDNLNELEEYLQSAKKQYEPNRSMIVGYDSLFTFYRHNEVWIRAA